MSDFWAENDVEADTEYLSVILEGYDSALEEGRRVQTGEVEEQYDYIIADYCAEHELRATSFEGIDTFGEFKEELTKIVGHKVYEEMKE